MIVGALIAGASVFGLAVGAGDSGAEIKAGNYKNQRLIYGFVPTPESNVRVVGNTYQQDYYTLGPQNLMQYQVRQTKNGGVVSYSSHPVSEWFWRYEFHRTKNGYVGTEYTYGIPFGTVLLKEQPKRR
ncbi:hypothetical protein [Gordonia paraffinivorans]|uniref:hypothetical protein n=1 Tax=Gordonia paraffinivorans TaxID=175628 RepID=UPI00215A8EF9|nr:hypothetical protein [Gordonia paraffinivorans]